MRKTLAIGNNGVRVFRVALTPQLLEDAQKDLRSHPPTPVRQDAHFTGHGRSEGRGERTLRYVESLSDVRTLLAGFFSILLTG